MKKENTLIMVSSEKEPQINQIVSRKSDNRLAIVNELTVEDPNRHLHTTQHLYIISNEEIKEGDWFVLRNKEIKKCYKAINQYEVSYDLVENQYDLESRAFCKKIIATTNPELWRFEFSEDRVAKIGIDFVERFVKEWNKGNKIEKVMVEYESVWFEGDDNPNNCKEELKLRSNGTVIISPIEEKKYSKYHINMAIREAIMYPEKFMTGIVHDDKKSLAWVEDELKLISK